MLVARDHSKTVREPGGRPVPTDRASALTTLSGAYGRLP